MCAMEKQLSQEARRLTDYTSGTLFKPAAQDSLSALVDSKKM